MSGRDDLVQLGKSATAGDTQEAPDSVAIDYPLPYRVQLPTRYYNRIAVAATAREFAEIAEVEIKVGDGMIDLTFTRADAEAGAVIDEFLNHALFASATAEPESHR
jgi:hypothetical protein